MYSTSKSKGIWMMHDSYGTSSRNSASGGTWYWVDWSPRSDTSKGSCATVSIGVSYVAALNETYTQCETWDITKYSTAGSFNNYWRYNPILSLGVNQSEREVAHLTMIKTPTGKNVVWTFDHGFYAVIPGA